MRLLLLLFCVYFASVLSSGPVVKTRYGAIEGFRHRTKSNTFADVFLGIPFAQPPVGELRFEKPRNPLPWDGVFNATKFGPSCIPHHRSAYLSPPHSEDCLQLNIIRPSHKEPAGGFPVIVWIHGGGYELGSATMFGYEAFADLYTTQSIIVVSVQYRLSVFGFFSTGDEQMPGNIGMWDQAASFRWLRENIGYFGGDPSRLIAWGLSAGGSSSSLLTLSPYTRDMVHSSIEHSGNTWSGFAIGDHVAKFSHKLVEEIGCKGDVKACLKSKSVDELLDGIAEIGAAPDFIGCVEFGPRIDGDFLPYSPHRLVKETPPKPLLSGMAAKEGSFFTSFNLLTFFHSFGVDLPNELKDWNREKLVKKIRDQLVNEEHYGAQTEAALAEVVEFYVDRDLKNNPANDEPAYYVEKYTKFVSDAMFNAPGVEGSIAKRDAGWPVYVYVLNHTNEAIYPKGFPQRLKGSPHANEWAYVAGLQFFGQYDGTTPEESYIQSQLVDMIVDFAKNDKPSFPDVGPNAGLKYLEVTLPKAKFHQDGVFQEMSDFWQGMKRYNYDVSSLSRIPTESDNSSEGKDEL